MGEGGKSVITGKAGNRVVNEEGGAGNVLQTVTAGKIRTNEEGCKKC